MLQHGVWLFASALGLLLLTGSGQAQVSGIAIDLKPADIGLEGQVHPGNWVPIRVRLQNQASTPRDVVCRFIYPDSDGDPVQAERALVLSPASEDGQTTTDIAWLYGHPQNSFDAQVPRRRGRRHQPAAPGQRRTITRIRA